MADDEQITEPKSPAADEVESEANKTAKDVETSKQPEASSENVTYDESGDAIFTDADTKSKYKWCKATSQWKPVENEHYLWCSDTEKWIPKATENEFYRWCETTNRWVPKVTQETGEEVVYGYDEKDACHTYTDKDGAVFFFDNEKKAWFPKVDDDFLAVYQLNYGFVDNTTKTPIPDVVEEPTTSSTSIPPTESVEDDSNQPPGSMAKKRKAPAEPPKWFEVAPEQNTKVYVSNLPLDITDEEFADVMGKCGMVMKDLKSGNLKLKLYRDAQGELKGDGLCHYIKIESVELALKVLDESDVRGKRISVKRAEFQMRGEYNPSLKPRMNKKQKEKIKKFQEKLFDWRPEKMRGDRPKHERTVIIKNLFETELFEREVHLILDYQNDLREECAKCGSVKKVTVYDRHPEGVAQITMADAEEADLLIQLMNGRFFGQRKLTAEAWDGKTKYKIDESEADEKERLEKWQKYLESEDARKEIEEKNQQSEADDTSKSEAPKIDLS